MVERKLLFREQTFSVNAPFDSPFKQGALTELGIAFDGSATASGGTATSEGALHLLGTLDLVQFGQSRIKCEAASLYHLAAFYNGGYATGRLEDLTADVFSRRFVLPFHRMMEGAGIDASGTECFLRGTFATLAHYSTTAPSAISAFLRPWATTAEVAPLGGFNAPEWSEHTVDLSVASLRQSVQIDFKTPYLLPGIQLLVLDNNGGPGTVTNNSARVDGLARRVTVEYQAPGEPRRTLVDNATWGQLREEHVRLGQFAFADQTSSAGVAFVPLFQRRGGVKRDALAVAPGSSLTVIIDTLSTVEADYTAVTPAAGDRCLVLVPAFLATLGESEAAAATALQAATPQDQRRVFDASVRNAQRARNAGRRVRRRRILNRVN